MGACGSTSTKNPYLIKTNKVLIKPKRKTALQELDEMFIQGAITITEHESKTECIKKWVFTRLENGQIFRVFTMCFDWSAYISPLDHQFNKEILGIDCICSHHKSYNGKLYNVEKIVIFFENKEVTKDAIIQHLKTL